MEMLRDCIEPRALEDFLKQESEGARPSPKEKADALDRSMRASRDAEAEEADRAQFANRHERRKAAKLAELSDRIRLSLNTTN